MNVFDQVKRPEDGSVWITGASGGIGRALTLELASRGWTVHATARSAEKLEAIALIAGPGRVIPLDPAMKAMIARGAGHLAITASVAGYGGLPQAAAYSASKAGLIAMAESLALDLIDLGVRISVINPGFVETEATAVNDFEMPFLMQPEEAAKRIADGLARPGFEIAFPGRFVWFLRILNRLPNQLYFKAWRRLTA